MDDIIDLMDLSLSKLQEIVKDREAWCAAVHWVAKVRHDLETEQQPHASIVSFITPRAGFMVFPCAGRQDLRLRRALRLIECSAAIMLKFLVFYKGRFHSAVSSTNYVVGPGYIKNHSALQNHRIKLTGLTEEMGWGTTLKKFVNDKKKIHLVKMIAQFCTLNG